MHLIKIINLNYIKLSEIVNMGNKNDLTRVHPETKHYHSEAFGKLRTSFAKNLRFINQL
jgi:hypothetical protein